MAHQNLSNTGIVDGQIVEASEITQIVNAFTKVPVNGSGYDITISGSLNLTGSLLMTGSFVNEFSGQFTSLGLGVVAPTAPTMLHIKDTAAGGDPIVLLEGNAGTDNARIRFSNSDVSYDLGAYGSSSPSDNFQIVQDAAGSALTPFIIGKNTVSYTLYAVGDSVGVGLGSSTTALLNPLDAGSLQAAGRVSGSSLRAGIISASAAGENIHGTASYATYIETASTASYVKSTNIDFFDSVSQQVNSTSTIASLTGSYDALKVSDLSGISIKDIGSNDYSIVLSGSVAADEGLLYFGGVNSGEYFTFDQGEQIIKAETGTFFVTNGLEVQGKIRLSGSSGASSTRELVVGPNGTIGSNLPSSSLGANDLAFNRNNTAYIGNYNSDSTSKLALSAGGGGSSTFTNIELSASGDVTLPNGQLILDGATNPSSLTNMQTYTNFNPTVTATDFRKTVIRSKAIETNSATAVTAFTLNASNMPADNGIYCITFTCLGTDGSTSGARMVRMERSILISWKGTGTPYWSGTALDISTLEKMRTLANYLNATITFNFSGGSFLEFANLNIQVENSDTTQTKWVGLITIETIQSSVLS